jgi:hypothetical protein
VGYLADELQYSCKLCKAREISIFKQLLLRLCDKEEKEAGEG